jgi:hypothetical protein
MKILSTTPSWWGIESEQIARSTSSWSRDYTRYQMLRDKVGDYLATLSESKK